MSGSCQRARKPGDRWETMEHHETGFINAQPSIAEFMSGGMVGEGGHYPPPPPGHLQQPPPAGHYIPAPRLINGAGDLVAAPAEVVVGLRGGKGGRGGGLKMPEYPWMKEKKASKGRQMPPQPPLTALGKTFKKRQKHLQSSTKTSDLSDLFKPQLFDK